MATNPQLTPQQLQQLVDLYKKIDGLTDSAAQNAAQFATNNGNALNELVRLEREFKLLLNDVEGTREAFARIVDDIKGFNSGINRAKTSFKGLESLASQLQSHQANISRLSTKELENIRKKSKEKLADLELSKKLTDEETRRLYRVRNRSQEDFDAYQKSLSASQEIGAQIKENNSTLQGFNEQLENQIQLSKQADKKLNITGGTLKGLTKIPILGNLINAEKGLAAAQEEAAKSTSTKFSVLKKGIGAIGPSLTSALVPLALITAAVKAIQFFIGAMFEADQQVTDIAKSFNISKEAARGVRDRTFEISDKAGVYAKTLGNQVLLQKEIVAANLKINELLGVSIDLTNDLGESGKSLVAQFAAASKFLKLGEEEQKGLLNLTSTTGEEIDDINKTVLGTTRLFKLQSGVLLDERKVLKTVLEASNAIKLSTKGGLEGLTKSAIEASKLGLSLQKVSDIANGLLDFESQIAAELEAEVITGKDLNLELAQQAALNNDLATVASEVAKNIGSAAEYSKMNRLEQEALAKAVGMSREELADVLTTQENLNKLRSTYNTFGKETLEQLAKSNKLTSNQLTALDQIKAGKGSIQDYFNSLQAAGVAQEKLIELLGEQSYASLSSQTAQEKFNDSLEKAKESFTRFVDGGSLDKLADFITKFVSSVGIKGLFSTIFSGFATDEEIAKEMAKSDRKRLEEEKAKGDKADKGLVSQLEEKAKKSDQTASREEYKAGLTMETGLFGIDQNLVEYIKEIKDVRGYEAEVAKAEKLLAEKMAEYDKNLQPGIGAGAEFANGGIVTSPISNATVGEAGPEAIIPLESSIGREILNIDRKSTSNANMTLDNSQVIAAINRLTEAMMSNSSKEITLSMDGQTVGKVLTPVMTPMTVREINNTSIAT